MSTSWEAAGRRGGRRATLAAATAAAAAVVLFCGALTHDATRTAAAATPVDKAALVELVHGFSNGDTAALVRRLERRFARNDRDAVAATLLGFAYQQRAR